MIKLETAYGFFDDGLAFLFKDENGEPKSTQPYHIHVEIQTGSQELETCDLRLYKVEITEETFEEFTHESVCVNNHEGSGGPNIEAEGANPEHDPASPPRENETRLLNEDEENGDE